MKKTKPFSHPRDLKGTIRRQPVVFAVYLVLRLIVLATLVSSIIRGEYESAFICLLVLALFLLPFFIQQNFGIALPSTLEIIILLFIFAAEILGELECYFITYPHWDSMLHTTTGFLCAATGFALIDILNRNIPITIDGIHSVAVNGQDLGFDGYLDIGLYDTMADLFVNFVGAVVFSTIGYFYIKQRGKGRLARAFIPTITENVSRDAPSPQDTPEDAPDAP